MTTNEARQMVTTAYAEAVQARCDRLAPQTILAAARSAHDSGDVQAAAVLLAEYNRRTA